jgi:hypothetical protein
MRRECSALPASAPPLACSVSSSPMTCVLGLVLGHRSSGNKDLGRSRVCPFTKAQVGVGGLFSLTQLLLLAAVYELDLIFSLYFASCHLNGAVVLSWLPWFISRALLLFSFMSPTNPVNECFSLFGVMGEKGWPVGTYSRAALKLSWPSLALWIWTWHSDTKTGRALRQLVGSGNSLVTLFRANHRNRERNMRLGFPALYQPCKLGDCDCRLWHLITTDGAVLDNVILYWLSWFILHALQPFSSFITNPVNECFSLFGVMGEKGRPVGSHSKSVLKSSWTKVHWISTWQSCKSWNALRRLALSSLEALLRAENGSYERNLRLIASHQPCKLGDCDCSLWHLRIDGGVVLVNPLILNGSSCKLMRESDAGGAFWSLLVMETCRSLFAGVKSPSYLPWGLRRRTDSRTLSWFPRSFLSSSFHFKQIASPPRTRSQIQVQDKKKSVDTVRTSELVPLLTLQCDSLQCYSGVGNKVM